MSASWTAGSGSLTVSTVLTFEDLPLYAPNGSRYVYRVSENKKQLGGYRTWSAQGDYDDAEEIKDIEDSEGRTEITEISLTENLESGRGETADAVKVSASFVNEPDAPEEIVLTGKKLWTDYGDALGLRPDKLELTVTRSASSQTGQGNSVSRETVLDSEKDPDAVQGSCSRGMC